MRRLFGLIVFASLVLPALAQNKQQHPFTFEDMMALKRVGEPIVSPDGKWVLFSAVDVSLEANTKTPHVWVGTDRGWRSARDYSCPGIRSTALGARRQALFVLVVERRWFADLDCRL
jgi:hypothetical protein